MARRNLRCRVCGILHRSLDSSAVPVCVGMDRLCDNCFASLLMFARKMRRERDILTVDEDGWMLVAFDRPEALVVLDQWLEQRGTPPAPTAAHGPEAG